MLLMIGAEAAVMGTALANIGGERQRDGTWLVVLRGVRIGLCIAIYQPLEYAMLRAAFAHEDFVVAQQDMGVYGSAAFGTDTARQFVKDIVQVLPGLRRFQRHGLSFQTI